MIWFFAGQILTKMAGSKDIKKNGNCLAGATFKLIFDFFAAWPRRLTALPTLVAR